ncbi:MAG: PaaI family thioesterase [Pseudomonadota bacterium]
MTLTPRDPYFEARVRNSFARQDFMATLGAELAHVAPGEADIVLPFTDDLRQQHGFFHAGATIAVLDSAAGYAALTLFPKGFGVLTAELKVNLLAPAEGPRLRAEGRVIKPGKTLTVCRSDVYSVADDKRTHVATALLTMAAREGLDD